MIRFGFCIVIFMLLPFKGSSQLVSKINFDEIKNTITDSSSLLFYPTLVNRLKLLDTNLTNKEFKHLYYGNVFQTYYYPYGATEKQKLFSKAFELNQSFTKIESLGKEVLQENPVNLDVLLKMIRLYNHNKDVNNATIYAKIYVSFLEVIYASGTGKKCENGFVVVSVDDEYRITADLGLKVIQQALIGYCDRLVFSKKGQNRKNRIKNLYFNVRMPLTYLSKSFDQPNLPEAETSPDEDE